MSMSDPIRVLAVNCSPATGGKTRTALESVLAGARQAGAQVDLIELADVAGDYAPVVAELSSAEAFVFGSPMYRASYTAQFKTLMDGTPRGMWGETQAPLTGRAVLTVATAASDHHLLGPSAMRDVLVDFFSAHLVSPGLYLTGQSFQDGALKAEPAARAELMGLALVELATAIRGSAGLKALTPNA